MALLSAVALVLLPVFPALAAAPRTRGKIVEVGLGKEFRLEKGESARLPGGRDFLRIERFINAPCPQGAQCAWSGQGVVYELTVDGKIVRPGPRAKYQVDVRSQAAGELAACDGIVLFHWRARCFKELSKEGGGGPGSCAALEPDLARRCRELAAGPAE